MAKKYQNRADLNAAMNEAVERRKDQAKSYVDPKERWKRNLAEKREKQTRLAAAVLVPLAVISIVFGLWMMGFIRFGKPSPLADALSHPETATEVSIDGAKLGSYPEELKAVVKLETLNLNNNGISSIPPDIGGFANLKVLSLEYNEISKLPDEIGKLTKLKVLALENNRLTSVPDSLTELSELQELDLSSNKINELPRDLGKLSELKILRLGNNNLSQLPPTFGKLSKLQELDLSGNPIKELPDPKKMPALRKLIIRKTGIPAEQANNFAKMSEKVRIMR